MHFLARYFKISLVTRIIVCFIAGASCGLTLWYCTHCNLVPPSFLDLPGWIAPFGTLFIQMLKMVVIPIVFFSLLLGAMKLPIHHLGTVGAKLLGLYLLTSLVATAVGVGTALLINPGESNSSQWLSMVSDSQVHMVKRGESPQLWDIIFDLFSNPFASLANSNFLGLIVFAILCGIAMSAVSEEEEGHHVQMIVNMLEVINKALFKIVNWVMEYAPIGVFALTFVNFAKFGPSIIGPYFKVVFGIIAGIFIMIFGVYSLIIKFKLKGNVRAFFSACKEPMITAFITRSSAATLPLSLKVATEKLHVKEEIASFSLPMGATINMDGVCVHLPMFAILTTNIFGIELSAWDMVTLTVTTVLAAIGTGGVPGGSLMLLFLILGALGLEEQQIATVISLALGVNPILDMFETMNNVTGDLMCTYYVGKPESPQT